MSESAHNSIHAANVARMILDRVAEVHLASWTAIGFVLVAGILMWLAGARFLKASLVLLGAAAGCAAGCLLPERLGWDMDAIVPAIVGLILGAMVGWLSFRVAAGVVLGLVLAAAVPVLMVATNPMTHLLGSPAGREAPAWTVVEEPDIAEVEERPETMTDDESAELAEQGRDPLHEVGGMIETGTRPMVGEMSEATKRLLAIAALAGAVVGFGMGLVMPKRGAAGASAAIGAAMILPAIGAGLLAFEVPVPVRLTEEPRLWIGFWAGLAVIGTAIQWTGLKRQADNKRQQTNT
ncbi:MAG TPA: hypothetical protein VG797_03060 [Phycisphaerales bacterium]|nr:hypothetical protein [Phycisphaerales bacterium]